MGGASPTASLQHAALAVRVGHRQATCSSSSAGTATPRSGRARACRDRAAGIDGSAVADVLLDFYLPYGARSAAQFYAWIATRHQQLYGIRRTDTGEIAVTFREHAQLNEKALMRGTPLTMDDYLASPWVSASRSACSTAASRPTARPRSS